jgi:hypothetical protein
MKNKPRTSHTIQKNLFGLNKRRKTNKYTNPYVRCRLDPFTNYGSTMVGIPDGDNSRRLLVDHTGITDFTVNSGSLNIRIVPSLPYGAMFQPSTGTNWAATDYNVSTMSATSQGSTSTNVWTPTCSYMPYYTNINTNSAFATSLEGPYAQTKCRCVGLAWRITYSGTVANSCGLISASDLPVSFDIVAQGTNATYTKYDNSVTGNLSGTSPLFYMDFPTQSSINDITQTEFIRIDNNPKGLVKHNSKIYTWKPYWEQMYQMAPATSSFVTNPNLINTTTLSPGGTTIYTGFNAFDTDFSVTSIKLSNISAALTFRLEVKACWEYLVQPTSAIYSLIKTPPSENLSAMSTVENTIKDAPPAVSDQEDIAGKGVKEIVFNAASGVANKAGEKLMNKLVNTISNAVTPSNNNNNNASRNPVPKSGRKRRSKRYK